MNNRFSFKRFRLLVRQQGKENFKVYAILWVVITFSILLISGINDNQEYSAIYIILFCLGGCIIATTSLSRWTNVGHSSFFLLIPATITEKFLCRLFYGIVLYIPIYFLTYLFTRYILVNLVAVLFFHPGASLSELLNAGAKDITFAAFHVWILFALMSLMFVQSIWMITALSFKKWQFLIALLIITGIWIMYVFSIDALMSSLTHIDKGRVSGIGIFPYFAFEFWYSPSSGGQPHYEYFNLNRVIQHVSNFIWFIIFGMLYLSAWFKLKEREI